MGFSKLEIAEEIQGNPALKQSVHRATEFLLDEVGESASHITARWSIGRDERNRPVIVLEIADFTGSATAMFSPDELRDERHVRWRLKRPWGDLLQSRSHRQLEELHRLVHELAGD